MPEAISRSSVSQIASYGPPEELSTQAPKPEVKAAAQSTAESMPLEKADKRQMSYEKCIALHERDGAINAALLALPVGCAKGAGLMSAPAAIVKNPQPVLVGCVVGAIGAGIAGVAGGALFGGISGKIDCDDLPKKQ